MAQPTVSQSAISDIAVTVSTATSHTDTNNHSTCFECLYALCKLIRIRSFLLWILLVVTSIVRIVVACINAKDLYCISVLISPVMWLLVSGAVDLLLAIVLFITIIIAMKKYTTICGRIAVVNVFIVALFDITWMAEGYTIGWANIECSSSVVIGTLNFFTIAYSVILLFVIIGKVTQDIESTDIDPTVNTGVTVDGDPIEF